MHAAVRGLFQELGSFLGLGGLEIAENEACLLQFDDQTVELEANGTGDSLLMSIDLGPCPSYGSSSELCEAMLSANFYGQGTGGAVLGMSREAGFIAAWEALPVAGLTVQVLAGRLENLVNVAEAWKRRIPELLSQSSSPSGESEVTGGVRV